MINNSVGKTALLREILANNRYHVIYIDTRVSGKNKMKIKNKPTFER